MDNDYRPISDDHQQDLETVFANHIWPLLPGDSESIAEHQVDLLEVKVRGILFLEME